MDIHENNNTLEKTENNNEKTEKNDKPLDEKKENTIFFDANSETNECIHADHNNEQNNIQMHIEIAPPKMDDEKDKKAEEIDDKLNVNKEYEILKENILQYNEFIKKKVNLLVSASKYNKKNTPKTVNIKQYIKSDLVLNKNKCNKSQAWIDKGFDELDNYQLYDFCKSLKPDVTPIEGNITSFPLNPIPTKNYGNENNEISLNQNIKKILNQDITPKHSHSPFDEFLKSGTPIPSKYTDVFGINNPPLNPEVDLEEVVTEILNEVVNSNITTIENVIGKLRINYEEKKLFSNMNKRTIILLIFEDDTMRPVLKIKDKYMECIERLYKECDLLLDIEETNVSIPENITSKDVENVLFQDINYKYKDEYLNNYIPLVINNIISQRTIKEQERKYFTLKPQSQIKPEKYSYKESDAKPIYTSNKGHFFKCAPDKFLLDEKEHVSQTFTSFKSINNIDTFNVFKQDPFTELSTRESEKLKQLGIFIPENITNININQNKKDTIKQIELKTTYYTLDSFGERDVENDDCKDAYGEKDENSNILFMAYNNEYNCLHPSLANSCEKIEDYVIKELKPLKIESIYVILNDKFLQTQTIKNPDENMLYVLENHLEFGFVKLFSFPTKNQDIVHFIEREFNKVLFNDVEELNKKLLLTSQYVDFSNQQMDSNNVALTEELQVKKFLESKYNINNEINDKMKASTLYDIIINSNIVKIDKNKIAGFRTRLSKYLKDLGLQKKRYNDGFYYYGIVEKTPVNIIHDNASVSNAYQQMITQRQNEKFIYVVDPNFFPNFFPDRVIDQNFPDLPEEREEVKENLE